MEAIQGSNCDSSSGELHLHRPACVESLPRPSPQPAPLLPSLLSCPTCSLGFRISSKSFRGPFVDGSSSDEALEEVCELSRTGQLNDLYCVNERYFADSKVQQPEASGHASTLDAVKCPVPDPGECRPVSLSCLFSRLNTHLCTPISMHAAGARPAHIKPGAGGTGFTVFVYGINDIVSNSILRGGTWEQSEIVEVLWAMRQPVPVQPGTMGPGSNLFVDIGANLAWFTLNVASRGYRVAAFEGESGPKHHASYLLLR